MPTVESLLTIMREVRDSANVETNPHERTCIGLEGACNCARGRRVVAAWRAFHDALDTADGPRAASEEWMSRPCSVCGSGVGEVCTMTNGADRGLARDVPHVQRRWA